MCRGRVLKEHLKAEQSEGPQRARQSRAAEQRLPVWGLRAGPLAGLESRAGESQAWGRAMGAESQAWGQGTGNWQARAGGLERGQETPHALRQPGPEALPARMKRSVPCLRISSSQDA